METTTQATEQEVTITPEAPTTAEAPETSDNKASEHNSQMN